MNFNNPDDVFSSSPYSGSSVGDADETVEDVGDGSSSNDDSDGDDDDDDDGTMMTDGGETTDMSMASVMSSGSSGSASLDAALAEAAKHAGTQGIEFDEHGGMPSKEDDEIVASFKPWTKKDTTQTLESRDDQENQTPLYPKLPALEERTPQQQGGEESDAEMTMEMTRAVGGILQNPESEEEMSMDVTHALGGIISTRTQENSVSRRKSMPSTRRQSVRRKSSGEASSLGDETMELTTAIGGIRQASTAGESDNDEDMSMEFTSVMGGVLAQTNNAKQRRVSVGTRQQKAANKKSRESLATVVGDETMEMTTALGGIMRSAPENDVSEQDDTMGMEMTTAYGGIMTPAPETGEVEQDETMGMDMTTAFGGILPPVSNNESHSQAKKVMEMEADLGSSPFLNLPPNSPPKASVRVASETGSPSLAAFRGKGLRRSTDARNSLTPKLTPTNSTPLKKPATPQKQITPEAPRPTTPGKTPPSKNIAIRSGSPKKLFKDEINNVTPTPRSAASKPQSSANKLFQRDGNMGSTTPTIVLTPQRRVSSGVGIDKAGLGSPRVAELLDRRGSIGEEARPFVPRKPEDFANGVQFADPTVMEDEVDREHEEDAEREDRRKILEKEADMDQQDRDTTINLREMIQSMTPKKRSVRGRKSLHVGAAKGLLGKRPVELDDEDEDDENDGVKRLKGHQGSPVKNVKLPGPPSKAETTGRLTRAARKSLEELSGNQTITPTTHSPEKVKATTPRGQGRFRDVDTNDGIQNAVPFVEKSPVEDVEALEEVVEDDRIQLQDFLNMTNIRFMELTTTKRRHTTVQRSSRNSKTRKSDSEAPSLEDCVAAGAATIPMLELFQHVSLIFQCGVMGSANITIGMS